MTTCDLNEADAGNFTSAHHHRMQSILDTYYVDSMRKYPNINVFGTLQKYGIDPAYSDLKEPKYACRFISLINGRSNTKDSEVTANLKMDASVVSDYLEHVKYINKIGKGIRKYK